MPQDLNKTKLFKLKKGLLFQVDMACMPTHQPIGAHIFGTAIVDKKQHMYFYNQTHRLQNKYGKNKFWAQQTAANNLASITNKATMGIIFDQKPMGNSWKNVN